MTGTAFQNLRMLSKLCGNKPAQKLIFVTTMWDKISPDEGNRREEELVRRHWHPTLALGARIDRCLQNDEGRIQDIVKRFVKSDARAVLLREAVDLKPVIPETLYNLFQFKKPLVKWEEKQPTVLDDEVVYNQAEQERLLQRMVLFFVHIARRVCNSLHFKFDVKADASIFSVCSMQLTSPATIRT